jgi:phosphoribosylformylglycinamidine synthase
MMHIFPELVDIKKAVKNLPHKKKFHVLYKGKTIAYMDMDFVHDGLPQMELDAETPPLQPISPLESRRKNSIEKDLATVLSNLHVASKEWVVRQYDHEVQGNTIIKPLTGALNDGPSDASVIRPLHGSWQGVAVANDITPGYGKDSCYNMTACSIDACVRKLISAGLMASAFALARNSGYIF